MDSLTIAELQQALQGARKRTHKKIDILGLDACYMAMGEVAYQIRNEVSIVIGAEGLEPEFGWPYGRIMRGAKEAGWGLSPEALARLIVKTYVDTVLRLRSNRGPIGGSFSHSSWADDDWTCQGSQEARDGASQP